MSATTSTWTDRYLQAVSDAVGSAQRDEVVGEVRSALADSVDAHLERGESIDQAQRAAVAELGDPAILASRYTGSPLHLIGPAHFPTYRRLLRTLLLIVVPIVTVVVLLSVALAGEQPIDVIGAGLWAGFQVGIQLAFWVTVVFAVIERTGTETGLEAWTPDQLPELADRRITLGETVLSIASNVALVAALLVSRTHWLVTGADGAQVPVLDPEIWTFWMPVLLAVLLGSAVLDVVKYRIGRWTVSLAVVNTLLCVAFAGIVGWLWASEQLLNPAITLTDPVAMLVGLVPWIVAIISAAEIIQGWRGALRR